MNRKGLESALSSPFPCKQCRTQFRYAHHGDDPGRLGQADEYQFEGGIFLSQAAGRIMKEGGGGKIINIASIAGLRVQPNTPHYSIAKAGVIMATKCMAREWGPYNIRVNCIAPGATETLLLNDVLFGHLSDKEAR